MKIRVFGAQACPKCKTVCTILEQEQLPYQFVEADRFDDETINQLCDDHNVGDLPHVQFLDDNMAVVEELVGEFSPDTIPARIALLRKSLNDRPT